jgi:hypothetical protein
MKVAVYLLLFFLMASPSSKALVGTVFETPGPNCFSAALVLSGVQKTFRGVDELEMRSEIQQRCQLVMGEPQPGDVGVYSTRGGEFLVHAFLYVDPDTVIEKRGVGSGSNNAIIRGSFAHTNFIYGVASKECLQFSKGPECYNRLQYYRCGEASVRTPREELFEKALEQAIFMPRSHQKARLQAVRQLEEYLNQLIEEGQTSSERLKSYRLQLKYFHVTL